MDPISVLHLRDTHEIGGPGRTILETHRVIDRERFRLCLAVFVTRRENGNTPFTAAARDCGIPVWQLRGFNQYDPRLITGLMRLVGGLGIDIVHAHEVKSDVIAFLASRMRRVPLVTTLHGWIGNAPRQRALIALDKMVVRRFDCVIAVSSEIRHQLVSNGVPEERVHLLHNAIAPERLMRTGRDGFLALLTGRPVPHPVIASIGRLSREKGHADLLDALAIVRRGGRVVSAILAGDGPERTRLLERVRALDLEGCVHLVGHTDRPESVLEESDLVVLPSHTEGLPNAALEALAMGVPVLATRVGGTPEVVIDGQTGRLVPPHSPELLAEGIADFLANPEAWRRLSERGREVVQSQFSFEARTRRLEALYANLVPGRSR